MFNWHSFHSCQYALYLKCLISSLTKYPRAMYYLWMLGFSKCTTSVIWHSDVKKKRKTVAILSAGRHTHVAAHCSGRQSPETLGVGRRKVRGSWDLLPWLTTANHRAPLSLEVCSGVSGMLAAPGRPAKCCGPHHGCPFLLCPFL